jgi:uncharacterized membrane-anchored protein
MKLSEDPNVPMLDGWVNLTEAAELLGITRQHAYKVASNGGFKTLHKIGHQPQFIIASQEVDSIKADRLRQAEEAARRAQIEAEMANAT